jgi:hypothetical protein
MCTRGRRRDDVTSPETAASPVMRDLQRGAPVNGQVEVSVFGQVKVPTLRGFSGCARGGSGVVSVVAHAVGLAGGDDDGGVVEQPVEDADGGGVFG